MAEDDKRSKEKLEETRRKGLVKTLERPTAAAGGGGGGGGPEGQHEIGGGGGGGDGGAAEEMDRDGSDVGEAPGDWDQMTLKQRHNWRAHRRKRRSKAQGPV